MGRRCQLLEGALGTAPGLDGFDSFDLTGHRRTRIFSRRRRHGAASSSTTSRSMSECTSRRLPAALMSPSIRCLRAPISSGHRRLPTTSGGVGACRARNAPTTALTALRSPSECRTQANHDSSKARCDTGNTSTTRPSTRASRQTKVGSRLTPSRSSTALSTARRSGGDQSQPGGERASQDREPKATCQGSSRLSATHDRPVSHAPTAFREWWGMARTASGEPTSTTRLEPGLVAPMLRRGGVELLTTTSSSPRSNSTKSSGSVPKAPTTGSPYPRCTAGLRPQRTPGSSRSKGPSQVSDRRRRRQVGLVHKRDTSSATISAAGRGCLASATLCPAHMESASMSPVVPTIGGAGS